MMEYADRIPEYYDANKTVAGVTPAMIWHFG
jgi:hypothetical protein